MNAMTDAQVAMLAVVRQVGPARASYIGDCRWAASGRHQCSSNPYTRPAWNVLVALERLGRVRRRDTKSGTEWRAI